MYNPLSGRRRSGDWRTLRRQWPCCTQAGVEATAEPTRGQADAAEQARHAIAEGCDTIFACGGDGTAHDVLQGMVGSHSRPGHHSAGHGQRPGARFAVAAFGGGRCSGLLTAKPRRIALGRVEYTDLEGNRGSRFFTVAAGIGVDAHLFYKLNPLVKGHLGMAAYYAKATRLWLTHPMEKFAVEVEQTRTKRRIRRRSFPAAGGSHTEFRGSAARAGAGSFARSRRSAHGVVSHSQPLAYLQLHHSGTGGGAVAGGGNRPDAQPEDRLPAAGDASADSRIFVEADGELLGTLPAAISMVPDALALLVPWDVGRALLARRFRL